MRTAPTATAERPLLEVRCRSCHRLERWEGEDREVLIEGGSRRTEVPPELAAWQLLQEWHHHQCSAPVAACPACGQPLLSDDPTRSPIPWTIQTPEGEVVVEGHTVRGPEGSLSWEEADTLIRRHHSPRSAWRDWLGPQALLQGATISLMAGPALLWVAAVVSVVVFLANVLK